MEYFDRKIKLTDDSLIIQTYRSIRVFALKNIKSAWTRCDDEDYHIVIDGEDVLTYQIRSLVEVEKADNLLIDIMGKVVELHS